MSENAAESKLTFLGHTELIHWSLFNRKLQPATHPLEARGLCASHPSCNRAAFSHHSELIWCNLDHHCTSDSCPHLLEGREGPVGCVHVLLVHLIGQQKQPPVHAEAHDGLLVLQLQDLQGGADALSLPDILTKRKRSELQSLPWCCTILSGCHRARQPKPVRRAASSLTLLQVLSSVRLMTPYLNHLPGGISRVDDTESPHVHASSLRPPH